MPRTVKKAARKTTSERWVIKAGSNLICSGGPLLLRSWMNQVASLRSRFGVEVIWVTSGAIASAVERIGFEKRKRELSESQALSAIGQPIIMDLYNLALQSVGLQGAQVLLTADDIAHSGRKKNLHNTLERLLGWGVIPVLNENDAVATEEIKFGDNDSLSARVAALVDADRLIILTDVEGLYEENPKTHRNARLDSHLPSVSRSLLSSIDRESGSDRGTGGMYSKLSAAQLAQKKGIETWLVQGDLPSVLIDVARGCTVGTRIGKRR
jgi:glutamate 5-kinase